MVEWTGARYADTPTVEVETSVDATPNDVWTIVSDIHVMPELSTELQRVEWEDGATGPRAGARFTGHNKHKDFGEWQTTSTITGCERARTFEWTVGDVDHPGAVWRFTLEPHGEGTRLRQWVQMGPARSGLSVAIDHMPDKEQKIVFVRLREYETGMAANLEEIKKRAETISRGGND